MENSNQTNDLIKTQKEHKSFKELVRIFFYETVKYPLILMTHPIAEWDYFKREKKGKLWVAIYFLVLMCIAVIIQQLYTGFLIGDSGKKDFNILVPISLIIFATVLVTIGNWCITALFSGKGTMSDIFKTICYSFFPFIWLSIFATILSNYVTISETTYVVFFLSLAGFLTGYMIFFGLQGIHEFGLFKNILMIIATIVAVAILIFIMFLFLSLFQQMFGWVSSIINELRLRYF